MAKKKQEVKLKEPVRIRFKQLANGNQSIYLDYYTGDVIRKENYVGGKRQYEFLKLYLIPEKRLSGNFWLVSFKISYLCLPLFYETRTTPSCHPSGCAYRQL